ncbi:MAG: formate/nitrite transporter family protein [Ilumatobacteraceae bacterium]
MTSEPSFDALLPPDMAAKVEAVGVTKAGLPLARMIPLGILAGAFIGLGAHFSTVITADTALSPGISRLLGGLVFSLGLVLVVVSGAELFTGNTLIVVATVDRKVRVRALLRNWVVVYGSNFVGAAATALLVHASGRLDAGDGSVGARAIAIAEAKSGLTFGNAIASGILANALVCLAVWMTLSARSLVDKVVVIVPPITAFVAAGFEHSVANMYFFPVALFHGAPDGSSATWSAFLLDNLVPVTLGNIVGGAVLVGLVYWFVYLRRAGSQSVHTR